MKWRTYKIVKERFVVKSIETDRRNIYFTLEDDTGRKWEAILAAVPWRIYHTIAKENYIEDIYQRLLKARTITINGRANKTTGRIVIRDAWEARHA